MMLYALTKKVFTISFKCFISVAFFMNNQNWKKFSQSAMWLILTVLILFCSSVELSAQNDTAAVSTEKQEKMLRNLRIREFSNSRFNLWYDDFSGHWAGVDFGFNLLLNPDYSGYSYDFMENDIFKSNSTSINIFQQSIGLQRNKNTIGLVTGLGLQLQSYRLEKSTTIERLENGRIEPQNLTFDQNQKSKLSIVSLTIPLLAEFQIPVKHYKNRIYFSGGFYGGLRIGSHTKIKYRLEGKKEKLKTPGHYSLQDFKYGFMFRAGYRRVNAFATYDLVPLFRQNKGPELTPVTIGITLISL